jgi:flagellar motor protein MotB
MTTTRVVTLGLLLIAPLVGGCDSKKKEQQKEQAENQKVEQKAKEMAQQMVPEIEARQKADEAAAKAKADEAERDKLSKMPQDLFETSGLQLAPTGKGKLQSVSAVTLTNKSHHLVGGIRAKIDFMKDGDVEVSLPLQLTGDIPAGGTRTFSTADQTLQAGSVEATASETRIIVTAAHPEDPMPAQAPAAPAPSQQ